MNGEVVVDASVAVKWLVREVYSDQAEILTRAWVRQGTRIIAPYLMPVEVSNALLRKARERRITVESAAALVETLVNRDITMWEPPDLHSRALQLAEILDQSAVYDSHYLALAEIMDCDLWTADERFHRAASPRFPRVRWIGEG
ncbi:MAG: hypothetical protein BZY80_01210 [SAR202 cluster bacterium Io17-Chloro-G2]|nr:MAG: hypothetical protein BZY80_01210 [SAR202 cluster bacterium Io17-Chloro-G2]